MKGQLSSLALLIVGCGVAIWPGSWVVRRIVAPFCEEGIPSGFPSAGKRIGQLERFLIFTALWVKSYALAGIVLTIKAIYRFSDIEGSPETKMKISEYFIIGTFGSLAWTILVYGICRWILQRLAG